MYVAFLLFVRILAGLALSMILGFVAFYGVSSVLDLIYETWPGWVFVFFLFTAAGIGASLGCIVAWFNRDISHRLLMLTILLVLLAGQGGAWGGYYYKTAFEGGLTQYKSTAVNSTVLFGAALAANLVATFLGVVLRQSRRGWW